MFCPASPRRLMGVVAGPEAAAPDPEAPGGFRVMVGGDDGKKNKFGNFRHLFPSLRFLLIFFCFFLPFEKRGKRRQKRGLVG